MAEEHGSARLGGDARRFHADHSAHDVRHLHARWRKLSRACGLRIASFFGEGDDRVYALHPSRPRTASPLYLSAGIHGDEPAGTWGLLAWAEASTELLSTLDVLILPCLNPWGCRENVRTTEPGLDLNRLFADKKNPLVSAWNGLVEGRQFAAAFSLHEDFDARGAYLYELERGARRGTGRAMLEAADPHVGIEPRSSVEGRPAVAGLIHRRRLPAVPWEAEAMALYRHHTDLSITSETPSEFGLYDRVNAQVAALDMGVRQVLGQR